MCWHEWMKWETYENKFTKVILDKSYDWCEIRQKRICKKCGRTQDEFVR